MFNSNQIDRAQVERWKIAFRPTIKFPMGQLEAYALAEALEELAAEIRLDASKQPS
jgi:hypothetical protein